MICRNFILVSYRQTLHYANHKLMKWMRDAEQKGVEREKAHCKPDSKMKLLEQMDTKCVVQL